MPRPPRPPKRIDKPSRLPIRGLDRHGKPITLYPGDRVRVFPEMGPGGQHPLDEGGVGFYVDTVRATYRTMLDCTDAFGKPVVRLTECVVLTQSSWARCTQLEAIK